MHPARPSECSDFFWCQYWKNPTQEEIVHHLAHVPYSAGCSASIQPQEPAKLICSTPHWGFSLFFPSVNSSPTAKMSILLRDIFVLENTVPPGVLNYRNLHTYSSFSLPKPDSVHCNHKFSQNSSCHWFKQDTKQQLAVKGERVISKTSCTLVSSAVCTSLFLLPAYIICCSGLHPVVAEGGKRVCLVILTATL